MFWFVKKGFSQVLHKQGKRPSTNGAMNSRIKNGYKPSTYGTTIPGRTPGAEYTNSAMQVDFITERRTPPYSDRG
jgi:hypothetical protein